MAHLGADVAAYVDGQLPPARAEQARRHLEACERCRAAVADQELLKRRMTRGAAPEVPPALADALARLPEQVPAVGPDRFRDHRLVRAAVVLAGASLAVLALAYALGRPDPGEGDPVAPDVEAHVAEFTAAALAHRTPAVVAVAAPRPSGTALTAARMDELSADGWPCHESLGGHLQRLSGRITDDAGALALEYGDGRVRLHLVEQVGSLDTGALDGFRPTRIGGARVWWREGTPTVAAWQADGRIYTVVTDAGRRGIEDAVASLPSEPPPADGPLDRVDAGLQRMSSWAG